MARAGGLTYRTRLSVACIGSSWFCLDTGRPDCGRAATIVYNKALDRYYVPGRSDDRSIYHKHYRKDTSQRAHILCGEVSGRDVVRTAPLLWYVPNTATGPNVSEMQDLAGTTFSCTVVDLTEATAHYGPIKKAVLAKAAAQ